MLRHRFDCLDKTILPFSLINVAIEQKNIATFFFRNFYCRDIVLVFIMSRHLCLSRFLLFFLLDLFLLHSKPAKHKVGDYSIILH